MPTSSPNILYILADDMGYGDVRHLNPDCAFPTPNLDRLGLEGMTFTDAHSSSAVCTPSRYSILTGRYCWRTFLKSGVIGGTDGPLLGERETTVADVLKRAGYRTACIGKWHLGWNWGVKEGHQPNRGDWNGNHQDWIDFSKPVTGGPVDHGFDSFYGIIGSLDMPPYVFVENNRPVQDPAAWGTNHEFMREGPRQGDLRAHTVLGELTRRAVGFIENQTEEQPFFLYLPLTAPHSPIAPSAEFLGASGVNPYADFCMEVDSRVGEVLAALERTGLDQNTLVIFTADNGAAAQFVEAEALERHYNHFCSYCYRGYKSDIWDGGHRVPFLVRWPARVEAGTTCDQPVGIFDLLPTAAELSGQELAANEGVDAVSLVKAFCGGDIPPDEREILVHHSIKGRFAIRHGNWKMCRCPGSGGWTFPDEKAREEGLAEVQLYNVARDPAEKANLAAENPQMVTDLTQRLHRAILRGRSTPGPAQPVPDQLDHWEQIDWRAELPVRFLVDD
ncbi:MAG: sulfatase family protein [Oceanipulchritudo sp.]